MEFDKSKVFTVFNADEVKVGSQGYAADFKQDLIRAVIMKDAICYHTIKKVNSETECSFVVKENGESYRYFYLVKEPKEKTKRPCTREELIEILKKQGLPMLKSNLAGVNYIVTTIADTHCCVYDCGNNNYHKLCERFTLLDGTELWVEE